jgi:hypothetical protein
VVAGEDVAVAVLVAEANVDAVVVAGVSMVVEVAYVVTGLPAGIPLLDGVVIVFVTVAALPVFTFVVVVVATSVNTFAVVVETTGARIVLVTFTAVAFPALSNA